MSPTGPAASRRPRALRPDGVVGVIAPASAPLDDARLHAGLDTLRRRGLQVVLHRTDFGPHGHLCGPDDVRLDELNAFLRRDDVDALLCVRGGFGTLRLLPYLDYEAARAHPKLVVGYSDVTALQLALYRHAGLPSLSGPMVAVEWEDPDAASERLFWALAGGAVPAPLIGPGDERLQPVRPGVAEGVLLGGNLTLVTRLVGTPYLPPLDGALLFLEEVGEEPYRIDGLFAHLQLAGILERLGGVILGGFTEGDPRPGRPALALDDVLDHYLGRLEVPVARGLVYGHFPVKNTLPLGVRARLEVEGGTAALSLLEPVVDPR